MNTLKRNREEVRQVEAQATANCALMILSRFNNNNNATSTSNHHINILSSSDRLHDLEVT